MVAMSRSDSLASWRWARMNPPSAFIGAAQAFGRAPTSGASRPDVSSSPGPAAVAVDPAEPAADTGSSTTARPSGSSGSGSGTTDTGPDFGFLFAVGRAALMGLSFHGPTTGSGAKIGRRARVDGRAVRGPVSWVMRWASPVGSTAPATHGVRLPTSSHASRLQITLPMPPCRPQHALVEHDVCGLITDDRP